MKSALIDSVFFLLGPAVNTLSLPFTHNINIYITQQASAPLMTNRHGIVSLAWIYYDSEESVLGSP